MVDFVWTLDRLLESGVIQRKLQKGECHLEDVLDLHCARSKIIMDDFDAVVKSFLTLDRNSDETKCLGSMSQSHDDGHHADLNNSSENKRPPWFDMPGIRDPVEFCFEGQLVETKYEMKLHPSSALRTKQLNLEYLINRGFSHSCPCRIADLIGNHGTKRAFFPSTLYPGLWKLAPGGWDFYQPVDETSDISPFIWTENEMDKNIRGEMLAKSSKSFNLFLKV